MESGVIADEQISFSSQEENDAKIVRLHHTGTTWIAGRKDSNPWLQLDLRAQNTKVTRVSTQGSHQHNKMGEEVQATIQQLWSEISKLQGTRTNHIKGKTDQRWRRVLKHELLIVHKAKFIP